MSACGHRLAHTAGLLALLAVWTCLPARAQAGSLEPARHSLASRTFPAVLLPAKNALIKARQDEQVARVEIRVGSRVKAGQLLIGFVDAQERVEVRRAEARFDQARADFERMKRLHADEQISDELLEKSETEMRLVEADLELARILQKELSIRAPFDGVVSERYVDPGTSVELGDPLVRVSTLTSLRLEALLPEEILPALNGPKDVHVRVGSPETTLVVPLNMGAVVVDPASGTFLLHVDMANPRERLVPGSSCSISIVDRER